MVEQAEQLLHLACLRQRVSIKPHRLGIRNTIPQAKPQKTHEGKSVADLILNLVIGQVVKRTQDQRLEHQHCVYRLSPGAGLAIRIRFAPDPFKSRTKLLPRHHGIDLKQRVFLSVQARVTVRKIEKIHLRHHHIPLPVYGSIISQNQRQSNF